MSADPTGERPRPFVVPAGAARDPRDGGRSLAKAVAADTGHAFGLMWTDLPHGDAAPLHVHAQEDEAWIVVDGDLEFAVSTERADPSNPPSDLEQLQVGAGAFVYVPRGHAHRLRVLSPTATVWTLVAPGGLEDFLLDRDVGRSPDPTPFGVTIFDDQPAWQDET